MNENTAQAKYNEELRKKIASYFSQGEFNILCHDLGVDPETLDGANKIEKVMALIHYMQHRGQTDELIEMLEQLRPNVYWRKNTIQIKSENEFLLKMVAISRGSFDREIHLTKHRARKIDMAGISLTNFFEEIIDDPHEKLIDRLVNEDIRLRVVFVHPKANFLEQRWIEDNKGSLEELRAVQRRSVESSIKFFKKLADYYGSQKNSRVKPQGRFMVKLTKFCPYFSYERYDSDIYWGLYTADSAGIHAPMFLTTLQENYRLFDKLRNHYIDLLRKNHYGEQDDLHLIRMEAGAPSLNYQLAEDILGKEMVDALLK
jgi:hypothetical protein